MSSSFFIRPALIGEAILVARIDEAVFQGDKVGAVHIHRRISVGNILVAVTGDEIAGFCALEYRPDRHLVTLEGVAVLAEFTGQGIGTALLEAAEREAVRNGAHSLQLHVRADNDRGIEFYRSVGFRRLWRIGRDPEMYRDGVPAIRMRKRLLSFWEHAAFGWRTSW